MSEKNTLDGISAPILEETTYDESKFKKKKSLDDVKAIVLEDTDAPTVSNTTKRGLSDIKASVLEDTFVTPQQNVKHSLDDVVAPTLDAPTPPPMNTPKPTQSTVTNAKPDRSLNQVSAPVLSEEPAEQHKPYVSKYANADIEKAKQEGMKQARKDAVTTKELTEEEKKKKREAYKQLMYQRELDMVKKGGTMVIVLVLLGIVATVGFTLLVVMPTFKESGSGLVDTIKKFIWYYDVLLAIGSFIIIPKIEGFKTVGSVVFGLNTIVTLSLGTFLLSQMEGIGINIAFYLMSLICSGFIAFQLSSNENVGKYYSGPKSY